MKIGKKIYKIDKDVNNWVWPTFNIKVYEDEEEIEREKRRRTSKRWESLSHDNWNLISEFLQNRLYKIEDCEVLITFRPN